MQAILTKYLPATDRRGSRIKASCERGSLTVSYPHELSGDQCHVYAAAMLVSKFVAEDVKKYGSDPARNTWNKPRVCGGLPDGTCAHVFVESFAPSGRHFAIETADCDDGKWLVDISSKAKACEGSIAPLWSGILSSVLKKSKLTAF